MKEFFFTTMINLTTISDNSRNDGNQIKIIYLSKIWPKLYIKTIIKKAIIPQSILK